MKRLMTLAVVAVALLIAVPVAMAAKPKKESPKKEAPKADVTLSGKVTKIEGDVITLDVSGNSKTITLLADTKIFTQSAGATKDATKADLKVGQEVTITCSEDGKNALKVVIKGS